MHSYDKIGQQSRNARCSKSNGPMIMTVHFSERAKFNKAVLEQVGA